MKEPTFVFAHFMTPHKPYVFDEDGTFLSGKEKKTLSEKEKYLKQVKSVNKKIEILIDTLLSKSNNPPIIIIQGDHGPPRYEINPEERKNGFWKKATIEEIQSRFGILNAYLLPNYDKNSIHPSISPVNSFRIIFNYYFGTDLEILPDNSLSGHNNPINFTDILGKTSTNVNFEYDIGDKFDWKKIGIENPKNEKFSHIYNLLQVYYQREDLQLAFTKVAEGDLKHLFSWVTLYGVFVYPTLSNYSPIYDLMLVYEESSDLKSEFPEASNAVNLHRLFCWANSHINEEGKNSNPLLIPHESFYNENCLKNI